VGFRAVGPPGPLPDSGPHHLTIAVADGDLVDVGDVGDRLLGHLLAGQLAGTVQRAGGDTDRMFAAVHPRLDRLLDEVAGLALCLVGATELRGEPTNVLAGVCRRHLQLEFPRDVTVCPL